MEMTGIASALEGLLQQKARLDRAIEAIEGLLGGSGGGAPARGVRRGRPPARRAATAASAAAAKTVRRGRKNAPRGLLKAKIHQVLAAAKRPLKPVDLKNAIVKAGYPVRNEQTLYTQVFAAAKKDPAVQKTATGYSLKAASASSSPPVAPKAPAKAPPKAPPKASPRKK